ncbi:unnamed protein product [Chondrus crispus]|uniref:Uncharacterized protein n=1 Tax=Chondrus crispus TaxID=2769 RepID=R7QGV2_CHOCR|nr:unnamed protein product [Chondrus crispus]CDF36645.1 unnamed protein product [Chondrus crispus]|eukprot:XP_005716464.1 unnamed protein product [Chondrus crispus]
MVLVMLLRHCSHVLGWNRRSLRDIFPRKRHSDSAPLLRVLVAFCVVDEARRRPRRCPQVCRGTVVKMSGSVCCRRACCESGGARQALEGNVGSKTRARRGVESVTSGTLVFSAAATRRQMAHILPDTLTAAGGTDGAGVRCTH